MSDKKPIRQLRPIFRMLLELATGNLDFRLKTESSHEIDKLSASLNSFAAHLQLFLSKLGCSRPYYSYKNVTYAAFLLDPQMHIITCTQETAQLLGFEIPELDKKAFHSLLTQKSSECWATVNPQLINTPGARITASLEFYTRDGQIQTLFCRASRLSAVENYLITSVTTVLQEISEIDHTVKAPLEDKTLAQNLRDYILSNLDKPLPTIKKLASQFQTNEFRLKDTFRKFFGSGIHQFYNEQRLNQAYNLIQQSPVNLKTIGFMSGFNDYISFARAFKKKYGYPPGNVNRTNP